MMKKILCMCLLLFAASNVDAAAIESYQKLVSTLEAGSQFVIELDLSVCTGQPGMPTGYFAPSSLMHMPASDTAKDRIVTSDLHFTDQSGAPAYEYIKYTIRDDDSVTVSITTYNPQTFKTIGQTHNINCTLGGGIHIYTK
ncbi:MAG: VirK family protein [Chlamydiales bacterium]|nr:VirK family protein [Chlamydiales bacterium]